MGVSIVAIGNGTPLMAQDFVEQFNIPFPLFTDDKRVSYKFMNFHYGLGIGLSTLKAGFGATKKGFKQGKTQGNVWQQGGEALFAKGGRLLWRNANKNAEEHATTAEILKVIQRFDADLK